MVWYGSRDAPLLLAVPVHRGSGASASAAPLLNGLSGQAAATVAQAFVAKLGQDRPDEGFGLFFIPRYSTELDVKG